jgi:hypothetical protein
MKSPLSPLFKRGELKSPLSKGGVRGILNTTGDRAIGCADEENASYNIADNNQRY